MDLHAEVLHGCPSVRKHDRGCVVWELPFRLGVAARRCSTFTPSWLVLKKRSDRGATHCHAANSQNAAPTPKTYGWLFWAHRTA